jgi:periplasmic mercuric ion binding protein
MKLFKLSVIALLLFVGLTTTFAQSESKTVKVWGNCGMCKKTIEKAAKTEGVDKADWNKETKMLMVSFDASKTSLDQIQKNVAQSGYDNEAYKGDDKAYDNLPPCCQYDRKGGEETAKVAVWSPIEDVHMVMMNVMQPLMMNDDIAPARKNAPVVLEKVKALATASGRPADITQAQLDGILAKAQTYADVVAKNGSDKKVKKSLMKFRMAFKAIVPAEMQKEHMAKMGGMKGKMHKMMMH